MIFCCWFRASRERGEIEPDLVEFSGFGLGIKRIFRAEIFGELENNNKNNNNKLCFGGPTVPSIGQLVATSRARDAGKDVMKVVFFCFDGCRK